MSPKLRAAFDTEMDQARRLYYGNDLSGCFRHLERAHILGQRSYLPHVTSHYWMLKAGLRGRDWHEVGGQAVRMIASIGSLIGTVPIGNSGRAAVPALRPMPIPDDLRTYFQE